MAESFDVGSLIEDFRDEARDQVDRLDAGLLALEREGDLDAESRSGLMRTLHTLKGNAGMLGLGAIRDYVHVLENVLKPAPDHLPASTLERLFEGAAALRRAVEAAATEEQEAAFHALTSARHRLEELESGDGAAEGPAAGAPESADGAAVPTDVLRVPFHKLDTLLNEVGELLGETEALADALREVPRADPAVGAARERAETLRRRGDRLRDAVMTLRLVPLGRVLGRFPGLVRRVAREQGKEARLVLEGEGTEVDKSTADALAEPLLHLVRNAIDHGIEPPEVRERAGKPRHGTITVRAWQEGDRIRLDVEDDGAGLAVESIRTRARAAGIVERDAPLDDEETVSLIFRPGFSTRTEVSTVSGRGVGLDVVRRSIRALRGDVTVHRLPRSGTRFRLELPLTVAIVPSLVFRSAGELLAVPASAVGRTVRLERVERAGPTEVLRDGDELVPLARPERLFGWPAGAAARFGVLVRHAGRRAAIAAEAVVDQRDLVVKALPGYGPPVRGLSGGSVLPGGRVILMLDPAEVIDLNVQRRERRS